MQPSTSLVVHRQALHTSPHIHLARGTQPPTCGATPPSPVAAAAAVRPCTAMCTHSVAIGAPLPRHIYRSAVVATGAPRVGCSPPAISKAAAAATAPYPFSTRCWAPPDARLIARSTLACTARQGHVTPNCPGTLPSRSTCAAAGGRCQAPAPAASGSHAASLLSLIHI